MFILSKILPMDRKTEEKLKRLDVEFIFKKVVNKGYSHRCFRWGHLKHSLITQSIAEFCVHTTDNNFSAAETHTVIDSMGLK